MSKTKCPNCGEDRKYFLTEIDGKVVNCEKCSYTSCPECGGDLDEKIAYIRGNKSSDGYKCKECDWEVSW